MLLQLHPEQSFGGAISDLPFRSSLCRILAVERAGVTAPTWSSTTASHSGCGTVKACAERLDGDAVGTVFAAFASCRMMAQLVSMERITARYCYMSVTVNLS